MMFIVSSVVINVNIIGSRFTSIVFRYNYSRKIMLGVILSFSQIRSLRCSIDCMR